MKFYFTNFNCRENFEWDRADNAISIRVWEYHAITT